MNTYEMIYCFKPTLDPDSVETSLNIVEGYIKNQEGKIIRTEKLGRKKLSYEVGKYKDGFYVSTYFELDPLKIKVLKRNMKLNDNVIREMIIRIDKPECFPSLVNAGYTEEAAAK